MMRDMKWNSLLNLAAVFVLLGAILLSPGRASTISSLDFISTPTNNAFENVPAFPYMTSVIGSNNLVAMMCDSYNEHIFYGERWFAYGYELTSANVPNFQHKPGTLASDSAPDIATAYDMLGYIMTGILNGTINPSDGNGAVWYMFEGAPTGGKLGAAGSVLTTALSAVGGQTGGDASWAYPSITIYTPLRLLDGSPNVQVDGNTQYSSTTGLDGVPQEFVSATAAPEPGTIALMGVGALLIAIGRVKRRKLN